jgi:hypothetical protein
LERETITVDVIAQRRLDEEEVDHEAGDRLEDWTDVPDLALKGGEAVEDLLLGGLEDAVEPAQHDEREDDAPVLGPLVVAAEEIGDRPDETCVVVDRARGRQASTPPVWSPGLWALYSATARRDHRSRGRHGHGASVAARRRPDRAS